MPCSAVPNWPAPASTPHRLIHTGTWNAEAYSCASSSDASFDAPYNEMGASVLKDSVTPEALTAAGHGCFGSSTYFEESTTNGNRASTGMEYTRLVLNKMKPAFEFRQYSSRFTELSRLCSSNWRALVRPSRPARTLGCAAASITQSTGGSTSTSLAMRRSPCTSCTPSRFSAGRLNSLPWRERLSSPTISILSWDSKRARARWLPANPHTPETRTLMPDSFFEPP